MSLETVGKLVAQHSSTTLPERKVHSSEREQEIVRMMFRWITLGMIILGIGLVMIVANKSFDLGGLFRFLSAVVSLGGVGVATAGLLNAMNQGVSLSGRKTVDRISGPRDIYRQIRSRFRPARCPPHCRASQNEPHNCSHPTMCTQTT